MQDPTPAYTFTAAIGVAAIGPFADVFNEIGALMFVMGLLGGLTAHMGIKLPIASAWRPALVGGLIGFGLGVIAPPLLDAMLDVNLTGDGSSRGLAAVTYLVGILHERILFYLREAKPSV
jgi:hypothetical protein